MSSRHPPPAWRLPSAVTPSLRERSTEQATAPRAGTGGWSKASMPIRGSRSTTGSAAEVSPCCSPAGLSRSAGTRQRPGTARPSPARSDPVTVVRPPDVRVEGATGRAGPSQPARAFDVVHDVDDVPVTTALAHRLGRRRAGAGGYRRRRARRDGADRRPCTGTSSTAMVLSGDRGGGASRRSGGRFELVDARAESPPESRRARGARPGRPEPRPPVRRLRQAASGSDGSTWPFPRRRSRSSTRAPTTSRTTRSSWTTPATPGCERPAGRSSGSAPPTSATSTPSSRASEPPCSGQKWPFLP